MIKKLIIALLSISIFGAIAQTTNEVGFTWSPVCNTNVNMYVLYYGTNTTTLPRTNIFPAYIDDCGTNIVARTNVYKGIYSFTNNILGVSNTVTTVSNIVKGIRYYFILTCKTESGLESDPTEEVEYFIPVSSTNTVPSKVNGVRIIEIK